MRKLALMALVCAALMLPACSTPKDATDQAMDAAQSVKNRGGDADSGATKINTVVAAAAPGGDALTSMVENEDQSSNAQAGDSPTLVFGGSQAASGFLKAPDPVGAGMADRLASMNAEFAEPDPTTDMAALTARIEALEDRMMAHQTVRLEQATALAGDFSALSSVVFQVIQLKANGAPAEKLTADAIEKAAASLGVAVAPATEKAKK